MSKIIEKCGRSGVELHEIRRNVNANGDDTTSRGKPKNGYLDDKRVSKLGASKGYNANRPHSHGFGPSRLFNDQSLPKLKAEEKSALLLIDSQGKKFTKDYKVAKKLCADGYVMWSDQRGWICMAEGRRVAELLREKKR